LECNTAFKDYITGDVSDTVGDERNTGDENNRTLYSGAGLGPFRMTTTFRVKTTIRMTMTIRPLTMRRASLNDGDSLRRLSIRLIIEK